MSKDDRDGVKKQVAGSLKEAIGKIAGDPAVTSEGAAEKAAGEQQRDAADLEPTPRPA